MAQRFEDWQYPEFDEKGMTKWNWMCQDHKNLTLGKNTDIGAFTYINAKHGIQIEDNVQIGAHCTIYSWSTIDNKKGKVIIKKNARVGAHSLVMPGITIGENAVVGAYSFVNQDIPAGVLAYGIPVKVINKLESE